MASRDKFNGKMAIAFELGMTRDRVWREGSYQLRYTAKRVERPNAMLR